MEFKKLLILSALYLCITQMGGAAGLTGLVPLSRCEEQLNNTEYFGCYFSGEHQCWIFFLLCPHSSVSTQEMNLQTRKLNCRTKGGEILASIQTDPREGLVSIDLCSDYTPVGEIYYCIYDHCWFSFLTCGINQYWGGELNFNTKTLDCFPCPSGTEQSYVHHSNRTCIPSSRRNPPSPKRKSGVLEFQPSAINLAVFLLIVFVC